MRGEREKKCADKDSRAKFIYASNSPKVLFGYIMIGWISGNKYNLFDFIHFAQLEQQQQNFIG